MKKKISILFLLVCVILLFGIKSFAMSSGEVVTSIPSFEETNTYFGKLTRKSYTTNVTNKVVYNSWWAPWQKDIYAEFQDYVFDLYECEYYFDAPVDVIETFRLETRTSKSVTYSEKVYYSIVQDKAWEQGLTYCTSYQNDFNFDLGVADSNVKFGVGNSSSFKVTTEFSEKHSFDTKKQFSHEIEKNYTEVYENNRGTYAYVQRNMRQKFKVYIGYKYKTNYERSRTGSGAFGRDNNYSYTITNYTCSSINIFLIPEEDAYYHISYYIDNDQGKKVFDNQGHSNIIFA
ncbi:MAG: hypothetical protein NC310_08225 [Roseburia sp.]|nr:hypothetical protein [Anaeroplasma bactoclasticum]MCM1197035.1 hypothetical protein [Roseburia sp.]MCM1557874.1 hypothetical protein [Anaeroplasma bactoclasticum]